MHFFGKLHGRVMWWCGGVVMVDYGRSDFSMVALGGLRWWCCVLYFSRDLYGCVDGVVGV